MDSEFSLEEINIVAQQFWSGFPSPAIFAIHGEMGAGKTTLVHEICRVAGVTDVVGSPTFSIINEYLLPDGRKIYHLDLYRLKSEEEAIQAGVEDCFYAGATCFVEWPEKAPDLFPEGTIDVFIELRPNSKRHIYTAKNDPELRQS